MPDGSSSCSASSSRSMTSRFATACRPLCDRELAAFPCVASWSSLLPLAAGGRDGFERAEVFNLPLIRHGGHVIFRLLEGISIHANTCLLEFALTPTSMRIRPTADAWVIVDNRLASLVSNQRNASVVLFAGHVVFAPSTERDVVGGVVQSYPSSSRRRVSL